MRKYSRRAHSNDKGEVAAYLLFRSKQHRSRCMCEDLLFLLILDSCSYP